MSTARTSTRRSPVARALLALVGFYARAISPALPPRCRFYPSCSAYAAEALATHGAARGSWLALRRLARCGPWHPGGVDLVPAGTGRAPHSSCSSEAPLPAEPPLPAPPVAAAAGHPSPARATDPDPRRAPQEESSVA